MEATTPAEDATYFENREAKQDYLKMEIIDKGYDTVDYAQFLLEQKGMTHIYLTWRNIDLSRSFYQTTHFLLENGIEIDNWTLE